MRFFRALLIGLTAFTIAGGVNAQEEGGEEVKVGDDGVIPLYQGKPFLHVIHNGRSVKVQRIQDPEYELKGYFAKTARKCPPFCIKPIEVDPRVQTVGEIEVFAFMENQLRDGQGIMIDARTPAWFKKGTIPGSQNYPFTLLSSDPGSPEMDGVLEKMGATPRKDTGAVDQLLESLGLTEKKLVSDKWDFTNAYDLIVWCNGPACGQSPRAIKGLLAAGYPPEKLFYYRGGMQMWQLWGLTTVTPEE